MEKTKVNDKDAKTLVRATALNLVLCAGLFYLAILAKGNGDLIRSLTLTVTASVTSLVYYFGVRRIINKYNKKSVK